MDATDSTWNMNFFFFWFWSTVFALFLFIFLFFPHLPFWGFNKLRLCLRPYPPQCHCFLLPLAAIESTQWMHLFSPTRPLLMLIFFRYCQCISLWLWINIWLLAVSAKVNTSVLSICFTYHYQYRLEIAGERPLTTVCVLMLIPFSAENSLIRVDLLSPSVSRCFVCFFCHDMFCCF